jgi:hypothetical protein
VGREIEEAVPLKAENVFLVWSFVEGGVFEEARESFEWVQLALDAFFGSEIFRERVDGARGCGHEIGFNIAEGEAAIFQAGEEAIEIRFLLAGEWTAGEAFEW